MFFITFISNVDSLDWKDSATPENICQRVTSKVKNGSIVLFHNDADHTPAALPNILSAHKSLDKQADKMYRTYIENSKKF